MGKYLPNIIFLIDSNKYKLILILILLLSFITKSWRISIPDSYYFDEIYYGYTAEQYAIGNIKAWVWDYSPPKGYAYTWDHPPTGKLIMSVFVKLFGVSSTSRRLAPLLAGTLLPLIIYLIAKSLWNKNEFIALMAAFISSLDGLVLSLSRIALTDTILTFFIATTILSLIKKKYLVSALLFGLAISTKWTGIYLIPFICTYIIFEQDWHSTKLSYLVFNILKQLTMFIFMGILVYLASYTPLFIHFGFNKFIELHKQMWWYHTNLKATHPFQSPAYLWPIDWRPVWFWVDYGEIKTANIYAMVNPIIAWSGIIAVIVSLYFTIKLKSRKLFYLLLAYFLFWVPWILSPRIMFLYHYLPSIPFLTIIIAYVLNKLQLIKKYHSEMMALIISYILILFLTFCFFYAYWTGLPVNNADINMFHWFKSWGP